MISFLMCIIHFTTLFCCIPGLDCELAQVLNQINLIFSFFISYHKNIIRRGKKPILKHVNAILTLICAVCKICPCHIRCTKGLLELSTNYIFFATLISYSCWYTRIVTSLPYLHNFQQCFCDCFQRCQCECFSLIGPRRE